MTAKRPMRKPVIESPELSEACRRQLLKGHDFFGTAYGRDVEDNPEQLARMKEDWEAYRDELLAEWIRASPGTRPHAWWMFDAPARRETADGSVHPFDRPERKIQADEDHRKYPSQRHDIARFQLRRGVPRVVCGEGLVRYETEATYLKRLKLLLPGEVA